MTKKGIKPVQPKTKPRKDALERAKPHQLEPHTPAPGTPLQELIDQSNARERRARGGTRLPTAGTVLKKVDRDGKIRCECTVTKDGVTYKGKHFTSLSGAAVAAAEDLGLSSRSHNGFIFWGLSKPPRAQKDPVERLQTIFERYAQTAKEALAAGKGDEHRSKKTRAAVERHAEGLRKLVA